jgi:hypothetical protein
MINRIKDFKEVMNHKLAITNLWLKHKTIIKYVSLFQIINHDFSCG